MVSDTFCILPWTHLATRPSGQVKLCCLAENSITNNGKKSKFGSDRIDEIWNSDYMRDTRLAMINGEKVDACNHCYNIEAAGGTSFRMENNETRMLDNIDDIIEYSIKNNGEANTNPTYFDLRLGNLCNLKCRMCTPVNSSQIQKEYSTIEKGKSYVFDIPVPSNINDWFLDNKFWSDLEQYIPYITHLYFTGGEPTLIEQHYVFLEEMLRRGLNEQITLHYNTNLTNVQPRFMNILKNFKTGLSCSIDGYGKINNYIRSPSEWGTISKNFETYMSDTPDTTLLIWTTVQVLNVLYIDDLYEWVYSLNKKYNRNIALQLFTLTRPKHLSIDVLPLSLKQKALEKLENLDDEYLDKNHLAILKSKLQEAEPDDMIKLRHNFREHMETLDQIRDEKLLDIIPELQDLYKD